jgi:AbrB family looped-hinge helix DNA binding protein
VESVTINSRGTITIPANLRKRYHFKEGSKFLVLELFDGLTIIPIQSADEFRCDADLIPHDELEKSLDEDREIELKLESRSI